jgi:hypothetical protein
MKEQIKAEAKTIGERTISISLGKSQMAIRRDKPVKIGKELIHPDPELVRYLNRPCSWWYRNCSDKDLSKNCYLCKKNPANWEKPQKRGKHYFDSIRPLM